MVERGRDSNAPAQIRNYDSYSEKNAGLPVGESVGNSPRSTSELNYERLIITDPVTFRYLAEDPSTIVLEKRLILKGYQLYIVEQWACSRAHPTFVINTVTNDPSHTAVAGILGVSLDEGRWSTRLKVFFNAMDQCHVQKRDTPFGTLMVTNLSSFPSMFTVIPVPEGDVKQHQENFFLNENLKRLCCSGRAGIGLKAPAVDTVAKFHQLYRVCDRIPFFSAVRDLVRLCQLALTIFDKLAPEYADGLLCDITERAISDWWADMGTDIYNIEPIDGILGPTTVAALLGSFIGARNRLQSYGSPVPKDAFDIHGLKKGIGSFQKTQRFEKTRRLDRHTLDRLHRVTAKSSSKDSWGVQRAVKSTVAEFGGKGGEMVIEIVGGRDKAEMSAIETVDIDRFVQLVKGKHCKWLWHGKGSRPLHEIYQYDTNDEDLVFTLDGCGGYIWKRKRKEHVQDYPSGRPSMDSERPAKYLDHSTAAEDKEQQFGATAIKRSVTSKVSDARANLGRFRDAVGLPGLRHYNRKYPKESAEQEVISPNEQALDDNVPAPYIVKGGTDDAEYNVRTTPGTPDSEVVASPGGSFRRVQTEHRTGNTFDEISGPILENTGNADVEVHNLDKADRPVIVTRVLRRSKSSALLPPNYEGKSDDAYWPRHLSFSAVDDSILVWDSINDLSSADSNLDKTPASLIFLEDLMRSEIDDVRERIDKLDQSTVSWVKNQISEVEGMEEIGRTRLKDLNATYQEKLDEYQSIRATSREVLSHEGNVMLDLARQAEMLDAKLDYEVKVLQSRVEEVENTLENYERQVVGLEERAQNIIKDGSSKGDGSWLQWVSQRLPFGNSTR